MGLRLMGISRSIRPWRRCAGWICIARPIREIRRRLVGPGFFTAASSGSRCSVHASKKALSASGQLSKLHCARSTLNTSLVSVRRLIELGEGCITIGLLRLNLFPN